MNTLKSIGIYSICILLLSNCEPVLLNVDIPEINKMTVNSLFTTDSTWHVFVTKTEKIGDFVAGELTPIESADVSIWENGQKVTTLNYSGNLDAFGYMGLYKSTREAGVLPEVGKTYEIRVMANGYPNVIAKSIIPVPVEINAIEIVSTARNNRDEIPINIYFHDPVGVENYYELAYATYSVWIGGDGAQRSEYNERTLFGHNFLYTSSGSVGIFNLDNINRPVLFNDEGIDG
ncbi:MAG: DUF4249 domain-containing protein, partial [Cyclobacteriaceae bacterium]|nr:DUF4249 domain-containing protein [Cyclobacteriaceae bacterium]